MVDDEGKKAEGQAQQRKESAERGKGAAQANQGLAGQGKARREVTRQVEAQEQGWPPRQPVDHTRTTNRTGVAWTLDPGPLLLAEARMHDRFSYVHITSRLLWLVHKMTALPRSTTVRVPSLQFPSLLVLNAG